MLVLRLELRLSSLFRLFLDVTDVEATIRESEFPVKHACFYERSMLVNYEGKERAPYHRARGIQPIQARQARFTFLPFKASETLFVKSTI